MRNRVESLLKGGRAAVVRGTGGILRGASYLPVDSQVLDFMLSAGVASTLPQGVVRSVAENLTGMDPIRQLESDRDELGRLGARGLALYDALSDLRAEREKRRKGRRG
jgi:hypothetical protein